MLLQESPPLQLHQCYASLSSSVTFFLAEESPETWMLKEVLTTAPLLHTSQSTNNWKQDNRAQDPLGLIQYSYSYTLRDARCFLMGDT